MVPFHSVNPTGVSSTANFVNILMSAKSRWELDFNLVDLNLGRNFYLSQFLTMRPFIGLRGTWQSQCWDLDYIAQDNNPTQAPGFFLNSPSNSVLVGSGPYSIKQEIDVWGIGANGGFNLAFFMSKNWSIYGDIGLSALWVDYQLSRKDRISFQCDPTIEEPGVTTVDLDNKSFYGLKYVVDLGLGLRWQMRFSDDNYGLLVQLGWNAQNWINWTRFVDLFDDKWNDLTLHGGDLKVRFDF